MEQSDLKERMKRIESLAPCFICGHPKSGTTLLLSLLDSHPNLLVFPEELKFFRYIFRYKTKAEKINFMLKYTGTALPGKGLAKLPSGTRDYSSINREGYDINLNKLLQSSRSNKELFLAIFTNYSFYFNQKNNYDEILAYVEKTPFNEFYIKIILSYFPKAKFIHIIRDPRDNYLSYTKKKENLDLEKFCSNWKLSTKIAYKQNTLMPEQYLILRYENLVTKPEESMRLVSRFLKIQFDPILLMPTRNGVIWEGNSMFNDNSKKIHSLGKNRWKEKLPQGEIALLEEYLYKEMNLLNYQCSYARFNRKLPLNIRIRACIRSLAYKSKSSHPFMEKYFPISNASTIKND